MLACFLLACVLGLAIIPLARDMMKRSGHLRPNYAGRLVPASMGIPLVISATLASSAVMRFGGASGAALSAPCLLVVNAAMFAGAVDDLFGSGDSRGIAGHAAALFKKGILTTGILKAVVVLTFAALAVRMAAPALSVPVLAMNSAVVALAANFSNLLDLRPGRAAKAYMAGVAALVLTTGLPAPALVPVGLAGATLAGIRDDLAERSMLGDAGSNPLGAALGYWLVLATPLAVRVVALLVLGLVHVYAEHHSITAAIERNPLLRFLDALGRR
ncbi:MAG: hypothetical protein PWR07_1662 [Bacillota bacterium]|nr:hypothetical protein [Bacillota bacterium]MDK2931531.1 hypothetical protein [Bacillota bacterium]